jgi:hypothetical protein
MGYFRETQDFPDVFHVPDIINEFTVMLVTILLKQNQCKVLMLGVPLRRITGIWG